MALEASASFVHSNSYLRSKGSTTAKLIKPPQSCSCGTTGLCSFLPSRTRLQTHAGPADKRQRPITLASSDLNSSSSARVSPSGAKVLAEAALSTGTSVMASDSRPLLGELRLISVADKEQRADRISSQQAKHDMQTWAAWRER